MWFFENERRAHKSERQKEPSEDAVIGDEPSCALLQSSIENLLDRRIEHHSYRFTKTNGYPY